MDTVSPLLLAVGGLALFMGFVSGFAAGFPAGLSHALKAMIGVEESAVPASHSRADDDRWRKVKSLVATPVKTKGACR